MFSGRGTPRWTNGIEERTYTSPLGPLSNTGSAMRMHRLVAPLLLSLGLALTGCSGAVEGDEVIASEEGALSAAEVAATKAQIRAICLPNIERLDNLPQVRAQLDPLVAKLARHYGQRSATEKLRLVSGAWREIWTDQPFPMLWFRKMDYKQIYQVVSPNGHYWNLGDDSLLGFLGTTGALRGKYAPNGTKIELEFTRTGFRFGKLGKGQDLVKLASDIERGATSIISIPGGGKAPNGPIGIQGSLETVYVDADMRIDIGNQYDFKDASGKVLTPGIANRLFVLDRVKVPAK
jgi:hypothetical protein